MKYEIDEIKININDLVKTKPREAIITKLKLDENKVKNFEILRSSLDARFHNTNGIFRVFNVCFDYDTKLNKKYKAKPYINKEAIPKPFAVISKNRPVIVGAGPAGLFAALRLVEYGISPIVIEMGKDINERSEDIKRFWETGVLEPDSNVQFGLGGAGSFSDGKLMSRIKSPYAVPVLSRFVNFGAKKEIMWLNKPHLGTDNLKKIITNIKDHLIKCGTEFMFNSKVTDIITKDNSVHAVIVNSATEIKTDAVIMACGNAARDTYMMLNKLNVAMQPKSFAVGVRVEHDQSLIDEYTYGTYVGHAQLKSADYKLTYHDNETNRGVYSFCNCPGGYVINASTEDGLLAVNGMSYSSRNANNANSAIVVTVNKDDYYSAGNLSGVQFQREIEQRSYLIGGGGYKAAVMSIADYIGVKSMNCAIPSVKPGYSFADINKCFPDFVSEPLRRALNEFSIRIPGFESGVMTAAETRTSSPLRILRDSETLQSINLSGLYPIGEGAGYAGGILSSAVDGMKAADAVIKRY